MKRKRAARVYLEDIRDAIRQIETYVAGGKKAFLIDQKTQDAVIRQLSIVGEAAKGVPRAWKAAYPEIPWKKVVAMRNILIHEYSTTSVGRVWDTVQKDLPSLGKTIEQMLRDVAGPKRRRKSA